MIDLKDASMFLRLCQTLNLTKAANLCNVSVSTLSRTVNKLEEQLNTKLCLRDSKGVVLTNEGKLFEKFAKETMSKYSKLINTLNHESLDLQGTITIYCSITASYMFIPHILNEVQLHYPKLELRIETGDAADALFHLDAPKTDFVISALPTQIPDGVNYVHLASFPLALIAPKRSTQIHFDLNNYDLNNLPFIMPAKGQLKDDVDAYMAKNKYHPPIYSTIAGHESIVSTCALGFGLAIVPSIVYELSPFKNDIILLSTESIGEFKIGLCYKKANEQNKKIQAILQIVNNKHLLNNL